MIAAVRSSQVGTGSNADRRLCRAQSGSSASRLWQWLRALLRTIILRRDFGAALVMLTVLSLAVAPRPVASAHERLAIEVSQIRDIAAHGHSHEDDAHKGLAGHLLGHDSTDHSHQFAHVSAAMTVVDFSMAKRWTLAFSAEGGEGADFGIERPPKQFRNQ